MKLDHLYSVERQFNVPIEKLWHAWTDPTALETWHHPVGMSCVPGTTRSEVMVDGLWSYSVQAPGRESISYFFGKYINVVEHVHFRHSMHYTESEVDFNSMDFSTPAHHIAVDFQKRGNSSWAKFSQFGEAPAAQVALMTQGIESYFDSLEEFLSQD